MRRARRDAIAPGGFDVRQLQAFVTLVEHGRITAAAKALGLAQSTVSEAIASLERAVGAPVIVRRRGIADVHLTDAGRTLLPHARKVLAAVEDARLAVAGATHTARTDVDIVANESVSTYVLPGVLAPLRTRWPNTRFLVSVATCAGVRHGVASGAFDVGLLLEPAERLARAKPSTSSGGTTRRHILAPSVRLIMFGGRAHPLVVRPPRGLSSGDALKPYPVFVTDATGDFHTLIHRYFARNGAKGSRVEAIGTVEGVKRAVAADPRALGLLPEYTITQDLRVGTIARVELRPAPPRTRLEALVSPSRARHPAADDLLDELRQTIGGDA
jgi:DNA-binding transcriptional LysR family regulator